MRVFSRAGLSLLWLLALPGAIIAQEITHQDGYYFAKIVNSYNVGAGGTLEMRRINGDVQVTSWQKNSVEINEELRMEVFTKEEAQKILERSKANYEQQGNTVIVTGLGGKSDIHRNYYITVPKNFNLKIEDRGGDLSVASLEGTVDISTSGGDVTLKHISGRLTGHTSGGDIDAIDISGVTNLSTSGGDLTLQGIKGELDAKTSGGDVDLADLFGPADIHTSGGDISLVNAKEKVSLSTSGGDVRVENVESDLSASTSGGTIVVTACKGAVDVRTSGGDLRLKNLIGRVTGHTSGGDIDGDGFDAPVELSTSGGDVTIRNLRAAADLATSGGDLDVVITLADFSKPHSLNLRTSGGNITLTLPAKIPASIRAEIRLDRYGKMWKRYDIYSDFPLAKTLTEEDGRQIIRSTGDINGGGDPITLQTSAGDIRINKTQ